MDKIAVEGYDPEYGARPLRRAIQKHIEDRLSEELLKGTVLTGQNVMIDVVMVNLLSIQRNQNQSLNYKVNKNKQKEVHEKIVYLFLN